MINYSTDEFLLISNSVFTLGYIGISCILILSNAACGSYLISSSHDFVSSFSITISLFEEVLTWKTVLIFYWIV